MGEVAVEPLIENLNTEDQRIKDEIALILIEIGDQEQLSLLLRLISNSKILRKFQKAA